jgi:hypothetical protein
MLLNQAAAEALAPHPTTYIVFDDSLPGFGCRVSPGGVRAWIFEYRPGGGRRSHTRRMTIGRINALPYHKARAAAAKLHHRTRLGEDPVAAREEAREAPTLDEVIDRFLREDARVPPASFIADILTTTFARRWGASGRAMSPIATLPSFTAPSAPAERR